MILIKPLAADLATMGVVGLGLALFTRLPWLSPPKPSPVYWLAGWRKILQSYKPE